MSVYSEQMSRRALAKTVVASITVMSILTITVVTMGWIGWNLLVKYESIWIKLVAVAAPLLFAATAVIVAIYLASLIRQKRVDKDRSELRVAPRRETFVAPDDYEDGAKV